MKLVSIVYSFIPCATLYQRAYAHIKGLSAYNIIVYLRMNGKDMDPVGSCVVWSRPLMFAYVPKTPCVIAQFI